jgi:hypothetical protein
MCTIFSTKLLNSIVKNLHIDQSLKVFSLIDYIKVWRHKIWEPTFYEEFKVKGGITRGEMWELQSGAKEAIKHVFCM